MGLLVDTKNVVDVSKVVVMNIQLSISTGGNDKEGVEAEGGGIIKRRQKGGGVCGGYAGNRRVANVLAFMTMMIPTEVPTTLLLCALVRGLRGGGGGGGGG